MQLGMVEMLEDGPARSRQRLVLAHGAGAGMNSPFLSAFASGLGELGIAVTRFEFPYMVRRGGSSRRTPPDRAEVLLAYYKQVVAQLGSPETLFIGGKSMGGRMASMLADELGVRGVVCLGYPFHPPGRPDKTRTDHLRALRSRCLIMQGTRDPFGAKVEVDSYALSRKIELVWVEGGDHDLYVRGLRARGRARVQQAILARVAKFIAQHAR